MNKHLWIVAVAVLLLGAGVGQAEKDPVFLAEVKASDAVAARVGVSGNTESAWERDDMLPPRRALTVVHPRGQL